MTVSFNGLRKNATRSMNKLFDVLEDVLENDDICIDNKIQIVEKFNEAAMFVDLFNCLFDPDVDGDMDNLSDELSVSRLKDVEEED